MSDSTRARDAYASKNEDDLKNEYDLKNKDDLKKITCPPHLREYYLKFFLMISHLNSHRTTDIKPEMLSGVQTGNGTPHDKYNILSITHERTNRKDDIFMQRRLVQNFIFIFQWGQGTCSLTKHTRCWAYSQYPLCGIFYTFDGL